jgi:hypothetical protein
MQKRRAFNAAEKRRIEDENAIPVYGKKKPAAAGAGTKKAGKGAAADEGKGGIPKWKLQSLQFRQAMKAANEGAGGGGAGGGKFMSDPETEQINQQLAQMASDSLIPCPHCNRRFNEKAAERHIPKCKDIRAKPSFLSKNSNLGIGATPNRNAAASSNNSRFPSKQPSAPTSGAKYKIGSSNESSFGGNLGAAPNSYKNRYDNGW